MADLTFQFQTLGPPQTPGDKRLTIQYGRFLADDLFFHLATTVPLDDDTREAAFTDSERLVSPFLASVQFGWDQRAHRMRALERALSVAKPALGRVTALAAPLSAGTANAFCVDHHLPSCNDETTLAWICKNPLGGVTQCSDLAAGDAAVARSIGVANVTPVGLLDALAMPIPCVGTDESKSVCGRTATLLGIDYQARAAAAGIETIDADLRKDGCRDADFLFAVLRDQDPDTYAKVQAVAEAKGFAVLADMNFAHDRTDAYADGAATDLTSYENYDLQLGFDGTHVGSSAKDKLIQTVELRVNAEELGQSNTLEIRLGVLFTPVKDTTAARFGFALIGRTALSDMPELGIRKNDWTVTPVAFIGGTSTVP